CWRRAGERVRKCESARVRECESARVRECESAVESRQDGVGIPSTAPASRECSMHDELTQRIITHVAQTHALSEEAVTLESSFDELGIDSLGAMSLVAD